MEELLRSKRFKIKHLEDGSGSWWEKRVKHKEIGYTIGVDLDWKIIYVDIDHNGICEELKRWRLNEKNFNKVISLWDN